MKEKRRAHNFKDLTGHQIGRLKIVQLDGFNKRHQARWLCLCACGNHKSVDSYNLISGQTSSCGCLHSELIKLSRRHGQTHKGSIAKEYRVWQSMKDRCFRQRNKRYEDYGGRGITVCSSWHIFENFLADMGKCPNGLTLDRINNDGNYEPSNCRWATYKEQANNKRSTNQFPPQAGAESLQSPAASLQDETEEFESLMRELRCYELAEKGIAVTIKIGGATPLWGNQREFTI